MSEQNDKPAGILSAAEIEAMRTRVADPRNAPRLLGDAIRLLAHLDAHLDAVAPTPGEVDAEARAEVHADFAGGLSVCSKPGAVTKDVDRITCPLCLRKMFNTATDDADEMRKRVEALVEDVEQARAEGARVEREACACAVETYGKPPAWIPADVANSIADKLRARGVR